MKKLLSVTSALLFAVLLLTSFAFPLSAADGEEDIEETFPDYTATLYTSE